MSKHYHVTAGLRGGYIPNTDEVYDTKSAALDVALGLANDYRESGEHVSGSRKIGYWVARRGAFGEHYDYVSVRDCDEPQCADLPGEWD